MLRLPAVRVLVPQTVDEAVTMLAEHGDAARVLAGGTDLLPNMKHGVTTPDVLVGLWGVEGIEGIERRGDVFEIGARTTIHTLSEDQGLQAALPSLSRAASMVGGPQLRRMGTIGGNVCLDTRCVYINQTHFWRRALGYCLKKDGTVCHVVKAGRRCVAAASNDTAPVLMTLGARLRFASRSETREIPIDDFYIGNGAFNQARRPDELLTHILVPSQAPGTRLGYIKMRTRAAIDFSELGVAVRARLRNSGEIEDVDICVTALASRPVRVRTDPATYRGRPWSAALVDSLASAAFKQCKPLTNLAGDPAYRRAMVPVHVRRAFDAAEPCL